MLMWCVMLLANVAFANPHLENAKEFYRTTVQEVHRQVDALLEQKAKELQLHTKQLMEQVAAGVSMQALKENRQQFGTASTLLGEALDQAQETSAYNTASYKQLLAKRRALERRLHTWASRLWPVEHAIEKLQPQLPQAHREMLCKTQLEQLPLPSPGYPSLPQIASETLLLRQVLVRTETGSSRFVQTTDREESQTCIQGFCSDSALGQRVDLLRRNMSTIEKQTRMYGKKLCQQLGKGQRSRSARALSDRWREAHTWSLEKEEEYTDRICEAEQEFEQALTDFARQHSQKHQEAYEEECAQLEQGNTEVREAMDWIKTQPISPIILAEDYCLQEANWEGTVGREVKRFETKCAEVIKQQRSHLQAQDKQMREADALLEKLHGSLQVYRERLIQKDAAKLAEPGIRNIEVSAMTFAWISTYRKHVKPLQVKLMRLVRKAPSYEDKMRCVQRVEAEAKRHLRRMKRRLLVEENANDPAILAMQQRFFQFLERYRTQLTQRFVSKSGLQKESRTASRQGEKKNKVQEKTTISQPQPKVRHTRGDSQVHDSQKFVTKSLQQFAVWVDIQLYTAGLLGTVIPPEFEGWLSNKLRKKGVLSEGQARQFNAWLSGRLRGGGLQRGASLVTGF